MIITIVLWTLAMVGVLLVIAVVWARVLMRQLRNEQTKFESGDYGDHPGPMPGIVKSKSVQTLRNEFELHSFCLLGYSANLNKLRNGRPNVDLAFTSADRTMTGQISCMVWPRTLLYLNLPFAALTGKWVVMASIETALKEGYWIATVAMDHVKEVERKQNFSLYYLGSNQTVSKLIEKHLEAIVIYDRDRILPIEDMSQFVANQRKIHEALAFESRQEFEKMMNEVSESWPVEIDTK